MTNMDATTLERFQNQLEAMETELRGSVEGKADSTAPVQVDSSSPIRWRRRSSSGR